MTRDSAAAALIGSLTADAAALGLHWIYDPARIEDIGKREGRLAFVPINASSYEGVSGYFAHGSRRNGMLSQYGECLRLTVDTMNANGGEFDVAAYQQAFVEHFGMGGSYTGYIDRPTRAAVTNIQNEVAPSGSDDDQLPALTRLPALVIALHGQEGLLDAVDTAIEITNVNPLATGYGRVFTDLLTRVLQGQALAEALHVAADAAAEQLRAPLRAALQTDVADSVAYGEVTERACHLAQGMPLAFHILAHADDYRDAVTRNIAAGGDSCGRAIPIGAVMGAAGGMTSIPPEWLLALDNGATLLAACQRLAAAT